MSRTLLAWLVAAVLAYSSAALQVIERPHYIQWVDCALDVPQHLQATALPRTLHCGRLDVPMDYAEPLAANNIVSLGFSMHRPNKPQGLRNL
jgi:hypothetical protein